MLWEHTAETAHLIHKERAELEKAAWMSVSPGKSSERVRVSPWKGIMSTGRACARTR